MIARGIDILQVNMVVNYDIPLMNERGNSTSDDGPDVETYLHRIGAFLTYFAIIRNFMAELHFRSYGTFWKEGNFDQFRVRSKDLATDRLH